MSAGTAVGLVLGVISAWAQQLGLDGYVLAGPVGVGMTPLVSIGRALFVLARLERNRPLLVFGCCYVVIALSGGVLLLGGIGFALAERHGA